MSLLNKFKQELKEIEKGCGKTICDDKDEGTCNYCGHSIKCVECQGKADIIKKHIEFRKSCEDLIKSRGKQWQIKNYILKSNLWWIDFGEDCFERGLQEGAKLKEKDLMNKGKFTTSMNRKVCYIAGFEEGARLTKEEILKIIDESSSVINHLKITYEDDKVYVHKEGVMNKLKELKQKINQLGEK
jgi:hypothetical protein